MLLINLPVGGITKSGLGVLDHYDTQNDLQQGLNTRLKGFSWTLYSTITIIMEELNGYII